MSASNVNGRPLARDIRSDREGEILASPGQWGARNRYWLRPSGGGREWEVPPEFVQIIRDGDPEAV